MSRLRWVLLLLCLAVAGCQPGTQRTGDEQKEPYFLAARKRLQERDYQGAIDYFEKALDANPRSASAHIELGILYEQQQNDWPSALYHYSRALQIRPDYPSGDVIKQRIQFCKTELAKSVVQLPSLESLQRKLDAVLAENQQLRQQLQTWQNYYAGRPVPAFSNAPLPSVSNVPAPARPAVSAVSTQSAPMVARQDNAATIGRPSPSQNATRSYTVVGGDNLGRIASRFGVKVNAILSANPTVDPRRLRPGQVLVIPGQ